MTMVDNLPNPGSVSFLPSLLAHIRIAAPGLPLEPIIVQVLLLCIVSRDRNLILRTREEDIGLVSRLAVIVGVTAACEPASQLTRLLVTHVCLRLHHPQTQMSC